ncbi:ABC transporter ATP-binding protein [Pradoshia sp. D12]|nr:ABC transporter ATP-binding protein [Pradoshia sp. D12]TPF72966.1 ABC transporter ATP-binding protein [Bacillus sp. D12]
MSQQTQTQKQVNMRPGHRHSFGPKSKAKHQKETVLRIWTYLKRRKLTLYASIICVLFSTVFSLLGPYYIGITIDEYVLVKDVDGSIRMTLLLAVIYIAGAILTWLQQNLMIHISLKTIRTIREELFSTLHTLSLRFFDKRSSGDLMSRVTNDIDNLNNALSQSVVQIFSSLLTIIGVSIAMFALNWVLAIVSFLVIPLMIFTSKKIIQVSSRNYAKRQQNLGNLNGYVEEAISGKEVITLFGREQETIKEFKKINEDLRESAIQADTYGGFLGPVNNFINNLGLSLIIGTGAIMSVHGLTTIGVIAAFVTYSRLFFRPINQLSNLMNTIQSAIAGAERVFEIMDEVPDLKNKRGAIPATSIKGNVRFKGVRFGYEKEKEIIKGISLEAKSGQTIALVGKTGSGKTTIINLLSRFYDRLSGEIWIDDRLIEDYLVEDLRKRIGIVLQETYLFSGTIMENIRYGKLDASDEEVIRAAKIAAAHQFIKHLPNQYNTVITSGGINLSQGQRQLISIARAVLADSDILILDEATSSIDTRTEIAIQNGMKNLTKGRTTFVIAHRLKTIENADCIYVIDDGLIVEHGTHNELIQNKGYYHRLYESQFTT